MRKNAKATKSQCPVQISEPEKLKASYAVKMLSASYMCRLTVTFWHLLPTLEISFRKIEDLELLHTYPPIGSTESILYIFSSSL